MTDEQVPVPPREIEPVLEIGPSERARSLVKLIALGGAVVGVGVALTLLGFDLGGVVSVVALQVAVTAAPLAIALLRVSLVVDEHGIRVRGGPARNTGTWAWADLQEVAMVEQARVLSVAIRPRGSQWDVPGPQQPALVVFPRLETEQLLRVHETLAGRCEQHGVPFTEDPAALGSAPPGSAYRRFGSD